MKQFIDKYKYGILAIVLVVLFFVARSCENNKYNQQKGENKILEKEVQKAKDGLVIAEQARKKQKDSISTENIRKEQKIKELEEELKNSENKVSDLNKSAQKIREKIKNMSYIKVADSLNVIYKTKNAVADDNGVDLKGDLPNKVLSSVVDANIYYYLSVEKDSQLKSKNDILQVKDQQLIDKSLLLVSAEKSLEESKQLNQVQTDFTDGLKKENKGLRNKNVFNKILIGVLGGALIYQTVK